MEFLKQNYLDTTTSVSVDSNSSFIKYLIDRDPTFQYVSSGYTGATVTTIRVNFNETLSVSRIALLNHNLKSYTVYYNGVTANTFALTGGDTSASDYSSNSETSQYLRASSPINCTSVSIDLKDSMVSGVERAIGWLMISDTHVVMDRPPPSKGYKVKLDPKDVAHRMSDGGTKIQNVSDKFNISLSYDYITTAQRSSLKTLYDLHNEFVFCPFGTTTSWDTVIFPCVWEGAFDFFTFSDDALASGFSGKIMLMETPS